MILFSKPQSLRFVIISMLLSFLITPSISLADSDPGTGGGDDSGGFFGGLVDAVSAAGDAIGDAASAAGDAIGIDIGGVASGVADAASDAADAVSGVFDGGDSQGVSDADSTGGADTAGVGPGGNSGDAEADSDTGDVGSSGGAGIGGNFSSSRRQTPPPPPVIERSAELEPVTTGAFTLAGVTTFSGSMVNTGNAVSSPLNPNTRAITTNLLVDYDCDASIDKRKSFDTPLTNLRTGRTSLPLEVTLEAVPNGDHCFSFAIDRGAKYSDKVRSNNRSAFENFAVQGSTLASADVTSDATNTSNDGSTTNPDTTNDPAPVTSVDAGTNIDSGPVTPSVSEPDPPNDPDPITAGDVGTDSNPEPVTSDPVVTTIDTPPILFQIRSREVVNETTGQLQTVTDWTNSDITVGSDEIIAFKWDAPDYDRCLANIRYKSGIAIEIPAGATSANTETAGVEIRKVNGDYIITCDTADGLQAEESITVTVVDM